MVCYCLSDDHTDCDQFELNTLIAIAFIFMFIIRFVLLSTIHSFVMK